MSDSQSLITSAPVLQVCHEHILLLHFLNKSFCFHYEYSELSSMLNHSVSAVASVSLARPQICTWRVLFQSVLLQQRL